jgi:hypothetical protein
MPVKEFAMSLDRRNHAGCHIPATEQPPSFRLQARPRTGREFAQQLPIETGVQPQPLGDGQDDLSMRDWKTDFFGNMAGGQQGPLLMAGGARTTLLAREGDKHLVLTVLAANSGKAFLQIATLEKGSHRLFDDGTPVTVLGLKAFVVNLLEGFKVLVDQTPQIRRLRIAWTVEGHRFETRLGHQKHANDSRRESQSGQPIPGSLTMAPENGTRE